MLISLWVITCKSWNVLGLFENLSGGSPTRWCYMFHKSCLTTEDLVWSILPSQHPHLILLWVFPTELLKPAGLYCAWLYPFTRWREWYKEGWVTIDRDEGHKEIESYFWWQAKFFFFFFLRLDLQTVLLVWEGTCCDEGLDGGVGCVLISKGL